MLWTIVKVTDNKVLNSQANENKKNQDTLNDANGASDISNVDNSNKNLSTTAKLKYLAKSKKSNFAKTNSFRTDFLILETKEAFIHL